MSELTGIRYKGMVSPSLSKAGAPRSPAGGDGWRARVADVSSRARDVAERQHSPAPAGSPRP